MPIDIRNVSAGKIASSSAQRKKVGSTSNSGSGSEDDALQSVDSVELTGKAAQIQSLIQQMMATPVVDHSRVEPIREKIEAGRYHVESEQIASRMLDFEVSYSRAR